MQDSNSAVATPEAIATRSRDVSWYDKDLKPIQPAAREILEKYSGIPSDEVEKHVYDVREKAWQIHPYPCIGGFRFLSLSLSTFSIYPQLVARLQRPDARFLDLGCCFGQEIRRLVYDGVPSAHCIGTDLRPEFFELGYALFRDQGSCEARFFAADVLEDGAEMKALDGSVDVVCAGSFFHLFPRPKQVQVAARVTRLLKRDCEAVIVGRQVGSITPGLYTHDTNQNGGMYRHDADSWRELWDEVGTAAGVKFEVECRIEAAPGFHKDHGESNTRMLFFTVKML